MATFTPEELALAVEIHQQVKRLNSLMRDADGLGLYVDLRFVEGDEVYEPGMIQQMPGAEAAVELKVMVFKAVVVAAANATWTEPPDAVLPHGWMG
jgi:hypothetical protein